MRLVDSIKADERMPAVWIESKAERKQYNCSFCGKSALGYPFWECDLCLSLYCPHCGSRMENGREYLGDDE